MARRYVRDARGRFAGGGYSGQTSGGGARLKAKGTRAGGGAKVKAAKRATPSGAIRKTDVTRARVSNAISKNIERRNKAGLNPPTAAKESRATRVKRAAGRIAARGGAQKVGPARPAARVDGDAFAARMKRARGASLRRSLNESERENALTGAQRRATAPSKRFAASNQRQARAERTAAAAQAFYRSYGSASAFGGRARQRTAASPNFGAKRRGRRR